MKKIFSLLLLALLVICDISAKPQIISGRKYIIGNLSVGDEGGCGIGNDTYNVAYYTDVDPETADDTYFWYIKEESTGLFSIKNASTGKYIRYNSTKNDREALETVDNLLSDQSTLFELTLTGRSNSHYMITSAIDQSKAWNKRNTTYDDLYPVGMYRASIGESNNNFFFSDADGNKVEDDGKIPIVFPDATQTLGSELGTYLTSLTFSDKVPVIDAYNKELFLSIMPDQMGKNNEYKVNFTWKNSAYKLYIGNRLVVSNAIYTFASVTGDRSTAFEIRDNNTKLYSGYIKFTTHPIVQLYSDQSLSSTYSLGRIVVTEPHKNIPSEIMLSNIRHRGATSQGFPKKSYAIKLKDTDGQAPAYRSYLGLREDNNWILDAMWIDPARNRNRVTTDLWVDFSEKPYYFDKEPKLINGTRGTYVEVFLNDSYNGLYTMTEKVDRKQLNLKKFIPQTDTTTLTHRGGLYKSIQWSVSSLLGNTNYGWKGIIPNFSNHSETWDGFEVKYPDFGDGEPVDWSPMYNAVMTSSTETEASDFNRQVSKYYDLPVFRDYYLLIDLVFATDNHGKNLYFSVYDQTVSPMITITPWDLDGTWGRRWNGSDDLTRANQSLETYIAANEHMQNNLYLRLKQLNVNQWKKQLSDRYRQLRGNHFNYDNLVARFENKLNEIKLSDASSREYQRWGNEMTNNFDEELVFLKRWIKDRLTFLDNQYLGGPYVEIPDGVDQVHSPKIYTTPNPAKDRITLMQLTPNTPLSIVDLQGKLIFSMIPQDETINIDISFLKAGVYLLKNGQSVGKVIKQ